MIRKIIAIYDKIADKELSTGCLVFASMFGFHGIAMYVSEDTITYKEDKHIIVNNNVSYQVEIETSLYEKYLYAEGVEDRNELAEMQYEDDPELPYPYPKESHVVIPDFKIMKILGQPLYLQDIMHYITNEEQKRKITELWTLPHLSLDKCDNVVINYVYDIVVGM